MKKYTIIAIVATLLFIVSAYMGYTGGRDEALEYLEQEKLNSYIEGQHQGQHQGYSQGYSNGYNADITDYKEAVFDWMYNREINQDEPEDIPEETTTEATTEAVTEKIAQESTTTAGQEPTATKGDLGILSIPNAGIYVGLYSDGNAFQSRGKASVQYYNQYGIKWIADHVNQDNFGNLRNLSIGSKVYINDTAYTVVDSVYAADYYSNFDAWVSYIDESPLILQTCEGNGARLIRCQ